MTGPAVETDLQGRSLRVLTPQELAVGLVLLGDAWGILVTRVPGIEARLFTDDALRGLIIQVQVAMVLRVLNNPLGKLSESQDDYSYRVDAAQSTGALYLSDAEAALLGSGDSVSDGAFTIRPRGWAF